MRHPDLHIRTDIPSRAIATRHWCFLSSGCPTKFLICDRIPAGSFPNWSARCSPARRGILVCGCTSGLSSRGWGSGMDRIQPLRSCHTAILGIISRRCVVAWSLVLHFPTTHKRISNADSGQTWQPLCLWPGNSQGSELQSAVIDQKLLGTMSTYPVLYE